MKANSKKERVAKAAEKQVRLQRELLEQQRIATAAAARPAPVAVPVGSTASSAHGCTVELVASGATKIQVIKVVRNFGRLDLRTAKALVDNVPSVIAYGLSIEAATKLRRDLEAAGASITVEPGAEVVAKLAMASADKERSTSVAAKAEL